MHFVFTVQVIATSSDTGAVLESVTDPGQKQTLYSKHTARVLVFPTWQKTLCSVSLSGLLLSRLKLFNTALATKNADQASGSGANQDVKQAKGTAV